MSCGYRWYKTVLVFLMSRKEVTPSIPDRETSDSSMYILANNSNVLYQTELMGPGCCQLISLNVQSSRTFVHVNLKSKVGQSDDCELDVHYFIYFSGRARYMLHHFSLSKTISLVLLIFVYLHMDYLTSQASVYIFHLICTPSTLVCFSTFEQQSKYTWFVYLEQINTVLSFVITWKEVSSFIGYWSVSEVSVLIWFHLHNTQYLNTVNSSNRSCSQVNDHHKWSVHV